MDLVCFFKKLLSVYFYDNFLQFIPTDSPYYLTISVFKWIILIIYRMMGDNKDMNYIESHVFIFFNCYFFCRWRLVSVKTPFRPLIKTIGNPNSDDLISPYPSSFQTSNENTSIVSLKANS